MFKINISIFYNFITFSFINSNLIKARLFSKDSKNPEGRSQFRNPNFAHETDAEWRARMEKIVRPIGEAMHAYTDKNYPAKDVPKFDEAVKSESNKKIEDVDSDSPKKPSRLIFHKTVSFPPIFITKRKKKLASFKKTYPVERSTKNQIEFESEENSKIWIAVNRIDAELALISNSFEQNTIKKICDVGFCIFTTKYRLISMFQVALIRSSIIGKILLDIQIEHGVFRCIELEKICRFIKVYPEGFLGSKKLKTVTLVRLRESLILTKFCNAMAKRFFTLRVDLIRIGFVLSNSKFNTVLTIKHILLLAQIEDLTVVRKLIFFIQNKRASSTDLAIEIENRKITLKSDIYK